jgi:hypothetical protein
MQIESLMGFNGQVVRILQPAPNGYYPMSLGLEKGAEDLGMFNFQISPWFT